MRPCRHVTPPALGPADRARDRALLDCPGELRVVSFILVGVGRRESHESLLHFGAGAEVIVDGGGVTAARVCAGQHSPACGVNTFRWIGRSARVVSRALAL
jgi:hypothetical protein